MKGIILFLQVLLVLLIQIAWSPRVSAKTPDSGASDEKRSVTPDLYCGPRSVKFVLEKYGRTEDLIDLIRETQWPDSQAGSTLHDLELSLRKRGIYTSFVTIPEGSKLKWHSPIILHMRGNTPDEPGHFAVWLPNGTSDQNLVWFGLGQERIVTDRILSEMMSGGMLLTSREEILEPNCAFEVSSRVRSL